LKSRRLPRSFQNEMNEEEQGKQREALNLYFAVWPLPKVLWGSSLPPLPLAAALKLHLDVSTTWFLTVSLTVTARGVVDVDMSPKKRAVGTHHILSPNSSQD
jgi:hypothetical protein